MIGKLVFSVYITRCPKGKSFLIGDANKLLLFLNNLSMIEKDVSGRVEIINIK